MKKRKELLIKEKNRIQNCVDKEVYKLVKSELLGVVDATLDSICSGLAITVRKQLLSRI